MLVMLDTWQTADVSNQELYKGGKPAHYSTAYVRLAKIPPLDFELAMKSIKAKTLVLPGKTDLYFPPEDSDYEVANMSPGIGKCVPFPSIWGHW